jgi:hypothetical protein
MTLPFIRAEIERMRIQTRRQQGEILAFQRSRIRTASAELLLARMQATVDDLCTKLDRMRSGAATT